MTVEVVPVETKSFVVLFILALLCTSTLVLAQEDQANKPGFWSGVKSFFWGAPDDNGGQRGVPNAGRDDLPSTDGTADGTTQNTGAPADGGSAIEPSVDAAEQNDNADDRACVRCNAIVCDYQDASGEFLCPANLKSCIEKYGDSCRQLGCYKQECTEKRNTCWPPNTERPGPVICEGSYKDCVDKYTKCSCGVQTDDVICVWNDQKHLPGESFPAGDGCNTCSCGENGVASCTKRACPAPECKQNADCARPCVTSNGGECPLYVCEKNSCVETKEYCVYANQKRVIGSSFPDSDGCNTCTCLDSGKVTCTERACPIDECSSSKECPVINCIQAPCPVNTCSNGQCVAMWAGAANGGIV